MTGGVLRLAHLSDLHVLDLTGVRARDFLNKRLTGGATLLFAGNLPGTTQTMPLAIYSALESDVRVALALALGLLLLAISLSINVVFQCLQGAGPE